MCRIFRQVLYSIRYFPANNKNDYNFIQFKISVKIYDLKGFILKIFELLSVE